jgi:hypothetical protein
MRRTLQSGEPKRPDQKATAARQAVGTPLIFFSNQLFSLVELQVFARGNWPYPVELTDDDDDESDADEEAGADGDPSPASGRREYNPAKVAAKPGSRQRDTANKFEVDDDDEGTSRVRSARLSGHIHLALKCQATLRLIIIQTETCRSEPSKQ